MAKHLDKLTAIREAYKIERGNLSIYYKNGEVVHAIDMKSKHVDNKIYTFYLLKNDWGKFLYIQEKEVDEFKAVRVNGGIMVNMKDLLTFVDELASFARGGMANES